MNLFLVAWQPDGGPVSVETRIRFTKARCCRGLAVHWFDFGAVASLLAGDSAGYAPSVARWGSHMAVGTIRLDNRDDVARRAACSDVGVSDLELVLRLVSEHGKACVAEILGDFAFIAWDKVEGAWLAARDAFGVRPLYYSDRPQLVAFASRADLLATSEEYDTQTLFERALMCTPSPDRTAYVGVRALPPGCTAVLGNRGISITPFWSPDRFEPQPVPHGHEGDKVERFRDLFAESVRLRLSSDGDTWSQLSGGLDSSSVVSTAQWLARRGLAAQGLAGTISWVWRWTKDGDERAYSNVVVNHYRLRNDVMVDSWWWEEDDQEPPLTDEPSSDYPLYARERRMSAVIQKAGGRVLLTGTGSDHYLIGNMFFFADWIARGRVVAALRELMRLAALGRVSFWELAYRNAVLPLLPPTLQKLFIPDWTPPTWASADAVKQLGVNQSDAGLAYSGRRGRKYHGMIVQRMRSLAACSSITHEILRDSLDVRHPFLYRPLVEFGLQLPPQMCVQPHARKWILREAMRGILPETVRTRIGKGSSDGSVVGSLIHERKRIELMLADPIIAQLGCVDRKKLQTAYALALQQTNDAALFAALMYVLSIETWLRVRSGRWVAAGNGKSSKTSSS